MHFLTWHYLVFEESGNQIGKMAAKMEQEESPAIYLYIVETVHWSFLYSTPASYPSVLA